MNDKVQVDKHELLSLLERILFTTRDGQTYHMARQILRKTFSPIEGYQPTHSNLGETPQDE